MQRVGGKKRKLSNQDVNVIILAPYNLENIKFFHIFYLWQLINALFDCAQLHISNFSEDLFKKFSYALSIAPSTQ